MNCTDSEKSAYQEGRNGLSVSAVSRFVLFLFRTSQAPDTSQKLNIFFDPCVIFSDNFNFFSPHEHDVPRWWTVYDGRRNPRHFPSSPPPLISTKSSISGLGTIHHKPQYLLGLEFPDHRPTNFRTGKCPFLFSVPVSSELSTQSTLFVSSFVR